MSSKGESVAIYWDFENLHAGLVDATFGSGAYLANRFRPQDELIDVPALVEFALSLGPIAINRAFANWLSFGRYKQALLQSAIELIQIFPPGANAKNGADIKLCLDVMEDMVRFPHIGTIIVVGGDSDYMPLSYKVKAAGRTLVGIGSRRTTNQHWARSCHEFKFYESLIEPPAMAGEAAVVEAAVSAEPVPGGQPNPEPAAPEAMAEGAMLPATPPPAPDLSARELIVRALSRLMQSRGETWIQKARLRPYLQRMDSTFHESNFGYATFNELLASMRDLVETRRGEFDHELRLVVATVAEGATPASSPAADAPPALEPPPAPDELTAAVVPQDSANSETG